MPSSTFSELVQLVHAKHDEGERPYVLFLGTAASLSSSCSPLSDIAKDIVGSDDSATLFDFLDRHPNGEPAVLLRKYLRGYFLSTGYHCLAGLVKAGYFDIVLTTNVNPLLDQPWQYDSIDARRAEWSEVIDQVNELALSVLGVSFNTLCNLATSIVGYGPIER